MSGGLIPISDEQAKLGQEILKTLRGLGSFIETALGSTPEDLIAYLGVWRANGEYADIVDALARLE